MEKLGVIREDVTPDIDEKDTKTAAAKPPAEKLDADFRKQAAETVRKQLNQ
jgi:hypothetical protein